MSASKAAILENFSERTLPPSAAEAAPPAAKAAAQGTPYSKSEVYKQMLAMQNN